MVARLDVVLTSLDPVVGSEIAKTRPAVVVSPDDMNRYLRTVIVAPLTSTRRPWPSRLPVRFQERDGDVALDQLRTIDRARIVARLGALDGEDGLRLLAILGEMFAP